MQRSSEVEPEKTMYKFYRARFGFFDDEWSGDGRLISHYTPEGTVVALDKEPKMEMWEPLEIAAWGTGYNRAWEKSG